ncbi:hypothetical protein [Rheinheimera sp. 4Y26]|uniref:hypothetical protein n=1 Tax=Rheinheimera sp. 4Y26 TaxID=2977811 RepID=UPI0021B0932C|nr:hypothetical protein [Rheinheimera sp. 4Y26]MCT6700512.1 hypothetical protein [Rheinheimera sp. 4Y26]
MLISRFLNHKILLGSLLLSCSGAVLADTATAQQQFFQHLSGLCGKAFAGKVVKGNASDDKMRSQQLVMHVRECSNTEIKVPFYVGEDRSRTWVISKIDSGLRLKHDHRHKDGSSDKVTMYGGDTQSAGTATQQLFPADQYSKDMFTANNMAVSIGNTWLVEIEPGKSYRYGLSREGREFMVEFDLTKAVTPPPAPWGHQ